MKKISIVFILIFIIGCAAPKVQETTSVPVTPLPMEDASSETPIEIPIEEKQETVSLGIPADIQDLIEKGKTRTKSLTYSYKGMEYRMIQSSFTSREIR